MSDFQALIGAVYDLFNIQFTIYGFTFSFWQVFLWTLLAGMVLAVIGYFIGDDD